MPMMILFDVKKSKLSWVECNGLKDYYKAIGCEYVEHTELPIGGDQFLDILVDENGLYKEGLRVSALYNGEPWLVGNILFCRSNYDDGEFASCREQDMEFLKKHLALLVDYDHSEAWKAFNFKV